MGLAKKGSRIIAVNGSTYRWTVSADSGFMSIIVELDLSQGQRMEASVSYRDCGSTGQRARITPKVVQRAIVLALTKGWSPQESSLPPFKLIDADARLWQDDV